MDGGKKPQPCVQIHEFISHANKQTNILMSFLQWQQPLVPAECAEAAQTNQSHLLQGVFVLILGEE